MPRATSNQPITVSLTQFLGYLTKEPEKQLTAVRNIIAQHEKPYSPPPDIYKKFRDEVARVHRAGFCGAQIKGILHDLVENQTEPSRLKHYPDLVAGYTKFVGKKCFKWFTPPKGKWFHDDLTINLSPEIGLTWDGQTRLIKFYTNVEAALNKRRAEIIIHLINEAMPQLAEEGIHPAVLDVRKGRLFEDCEPDLGRSALLQSQAISFVHMYRML